MKRYISSLLAASVLAAAVQLPASSAEARDRGFRATKISSFGNKRSFRGLKNKRRYRGLKIAGAKKRKSRRANRKAFREVSKYARDHHRAERRRTKNRKAHELRKRRAERRYRKPATRPRLALTTPFPENKRPAVFSKTKGTGRPEYLYKPLRPYNGLIISLPRRHMDEKQLIKLLADYTKNAKFADDLFGGKSWILEAWITKAYAKDLRAKWVRKNAGIDLYGPQGVRLERILRVMEMYEAYREWQHHEKYVMPNAEFFGGPTAVKKAKARLTELENDVYWKLFQLGSDLRAVQKAFRGKMVTKFSDVKFPDKYKAGG